MFKLLSSLAIWQVMRTNSSLVKKILIYFLILLFSLYFFPDWEDFFTKKNNLDMLLYTKISKYFVLIYVFYLFFINAKQLSILGAKEKKQSLVDYKKTNSEEEYDPDLEIIRSKSKLRSHSDLIKEDIKKNE